MGILDYLGRPEIENSMGAIGEALSALDTGRAANMQFYTQRAAQIKRDGHLKALGEKIFEGGIPGMRPDQVGILKHLYEANPQGVLPTIMGQMFPAPEQLTDYQRKIQGLSSSDPAVRRASEIALQMQPGANAMLAAQNSGAFNLSPGQTRYDSQGNPIASAPAAPKNRQIIKGADGKNYYADTGEAVLPTVQAAPNVPAGFEPDGKGGLRPIPGGPQDPNFIAQKNAAGRQRQIVMRNKIPYYVDTGEAVLPPDPGEAVPDLSSEAGLRKEWTALTKDFRSIRDAYTKVIGSAQNASAAGDLALIFNYMKMLDPGSVVREGEFATAQQATGVPTRVLNTYNQIVSGQRLAPEQRQDFMNSAGTVFNGQRDIYERDLSTYREIARSAGLDPDRSVPSLPIIRSPTQAGGQMFKDPVTGKMYQQLPNGTYKLVP